MFVNATLRQYQVSNKIQKLKIKYYIIKIFILNYA